MNKCVASVLLFAFVAGAAATTASTPTPITVNECTKKYDNVVTDLLNKQIQAELSAQYAYLRLAHLFQQPHMYYPKMAKFFHEKSMEEMTHAEDFIAYQNQRGAKYDPGNDFGLTVNVESCNSIDSLYKGFKCAQDLEIEVTKKLTQLVADVMDVKYREDADVIEYNEDLRTGQAVLVKMNANGAQEPLKTVIQTGGDADDCQGMEFEYTELAEHISHEYLGHQVLDTKVLANVVQTLSKYEPPKGQEPTTANKQFQALGSFLADKEMNLE